MGLNSQLFSVLNQSETLWKGKLVKMISFVMVSSCTSTNVLVFFPVKLNLWMHIPVIHFFLLCCRWQNVLRHSECLKSTMSNQKVIRATSKYPVCLVYLYIKLVHSTLKRQNVTNLSIT